MNAVKDELEKAKEELKKVQDEVKNAQNKVNSASNGVEKLKAEEELQKLYAKQAAAESAVAEKEAVQLDCSAVVSQATIKKLLSMLDTAEDADKNELQNQLKAEEDAVTESQTKAEEKRDEAVSKKEEQKGYEQKAQEKNKELQNEQKKHSVTVFTLGSLSYKVTDYNAKTVTVTGPTDKKKAKTVTVFAL